ncbi:MAG: Spx/MgsR family RNA polymerase-binding regulatory protein [Rhabdochlamydiaceae bacterium]
MEIYVHLKCSTCKKALEFLKQNGIEITVKNIQEKTPSIEELQKALAFKNNDIKKLLNTSGLLYKEMNMKSLLLEKSLSDILSLMSKEGMLIKRPFLITPSFCLVGFKEVEWRQQFPTL